MSHRDVDVAIVGGGVAGTSLAIALSGSGARVAVIEREARFRDRVRGDALFPWGALEASRLGIASLLPAAGARPLPIWQTYAERERLPPYDWRSDVPSGDVLWGVDHPALQESLLQQAQALGAEVVRGVKALPPRRDPSGIVTLPVEGPDQSLTVRARLIVGADGSESGVRRWLGARTIRDPVHHVIGGLLLEGVDLDPHAAHVARFAGVMALLFRHGSGRARAYLVCQPSRGATFRGACGKEVFLAALAVAFPMGALRGALPAGPLAVFPARDVFASCIAGAGMVLIGDAAGANDPAQGQGLSLAFRDARELSHLLLTQSDWQQAIAEFARRRPAWFEPLRAYAIWQGPLTTDTGPKADAARERQRLAAERDPFLGGYGAIHALGPEGLPDTENARRHFLGEDL